ncbi:MAG: complex I NDUFA9 subunit family protein [Phycisphaerae bacterium]|nr:complex I NDUFA9 subunit family protein [Phycisphaerae bacterium]
MADAASANLRVFVSGSSGFIGRAVVRELIARGYQPVCFARTPRKLREALEGVNPTHYVIAQGSLSDEDSLRRAMSGAGAAIHLVGIIIERRWAGQSFRNVHVEGTRRVIEAAISEGVPRLVHMSALGTRPGATSQYHRTKWEAENLVRASGLAWTIFRPSLIHGPDGEFMRLMKQFVAGLVPPVIPYFGAGEQRIQPVDVRDVATCFVAALRLPATVGKTYELGGPKAYTWKQLYEVCRTLIPNASRLKPKVGVPLPIARLIGAAGDAADRLTGLRWGIPFNLAQVQMSQEDNTCDPRPIEETFSIRLRDFEEELARYGGRIR